MPKARGELTEDVKPLCGKYVISTIGLRTKKLLFYQDYENRRKKSEHWTEDLGKAFGFTLLSSALNYKEKLKFNSPRVYLVLTDGSLKMIRKEKKNGN